MMKMNQIMKIKVQHWQRGIALLILMLIVLLMATSLLLARLNKGDNQLIRQAQTVKALAQAKAALIGFAATYADDPDHKGQPQGYLPCPDFNGDGSSANAGSTDASCSGSEKSVIGRLPWRTLGLPPLRDGNGDCLWYAVSGSYKDQQKKPLTSDDDGLFIIKDADGNTIAGTTATDQAIAVVFSPGQSLGTQDRTRSSAATECGGSTTAPAIDKINDVSNYLESLGGINNATGGGKFSYGVGGSSGFFGTSNALETATFVSAPETKDANGQVIFNDVLSIITPKDFEPVYRRMNEWVAEQVTDCLTTYQKKNVENLLDEYDVVIGSHSPVAGTYRKTQEEYIQNYIDDRISNCKYTNCSCNNVLNQRATCITNCGTDNICKNTCQEKFDIEQIKCINNMNTCKNDCEKTAVITKYSENAIRVNPTYPWATKILNTVYTDDSSIQFGRVPMTLSNTHSENPYMSDKWMVLNGTYNYPSNPTNDPDKEPVCFESTEDRNKYEWWWWENWRDLVFYAVDASVTPNMGTYFWIDAQQGAEEINPITGEWKQEDKSEYDKRLVETKEKTLATIKQPVSSPVQVSDWEYVTSIPSASPTATHFKVETWEVTNVVDSITGKLQKNKTTNLNIDFIDFVVLVGGRRLSTQPVIPPNRNITEVRDYLEGNNAISVSIFEKQPLTDEFNDVVCINAKINCRSVPRGGNL